MERCPTNETSPTTQGESGSNFGDFTVPMYLLSVRVDSVEVEYGTWLSAGHCGVTLCWDGTRDGLISETPPL